MNGPWMNWGCPEKRTGDQEFRNRFASPGPALVISRELFGAPDRIQTAGVKPAVMPVTDEDLVAAVAAGDREAFGALYRRRRPDVYRFAMHMIGATGAAEDVAQDVFMTVIHEARRYDPRRARVVAWLLGIARNHARRRLTERRYEPLPEIDAGPSIEADPSDGLSRAQQTAALRR